MLPLKKEKIEVTAEEEQISKTKHVGRLYPHKGHTLFEVNILTGQITKAVFEDPPAIDLLTGDTSKNRKVNINEGCLYISALNKKNVLKILKRDYNY